MARNPSKTADPHAHNSNTPAGPRSLPESPPLPTNVPAAAETPPRSAPASAPTADLGRRAMALAGEEPLANRRMAKFMLLDVMGANVVSEQTQSFIPDAAGKVAMSFVGALRDSIQPRDAVEEMLVIQMAWTHARLASLSALAPKQSARQNLQAVQEACDRASQTFARQMLALAQYRQPSRPQAFVAIKQANLAQQIVQNADDR